MTTRAAVLSAAVLALSALVPAQEDRSLGATLLIRSGAGDLVLNEPLLRAIVQDPAVEAAVRKAAGPGLSRYNGIGVSLPAPHLAGTFQVSLDINLSGIGDWPRATKDAVVDAVTAHVERHLTVLLYEQPLRQLTERRDELAKRLAKLLEEHAALRTQATMAAADADTAGRLRDGLEQQSLTARLDLATEQRANEYLEKLRVEQGDRRSALREQRAALRAHTAGLTGELREIDRRMSAFVGVLEPRQREELELLRDQFAVLTAKNAERERQAQQIDESLADAQEALARTLEQLPASTLLLQRARARQNSIEDERKALDERAAATTRRAAAAHSAAQAELMQIDISVCRSLLTEVQGKLSRIEPVRCELLRQG